MEYDGAVTQPDVLPVYVEVLCAQGGDSLVVGDKVSAVPKAHAAGRTFLLLNYMPADRPEDPIGADDRVEIFDMSIVKRK